LKPLSPQCEVKQGNFSSSAYRQKISKEEIEVINNGGFDEKTIGDWRKIKVY
jgi:hypothetical protein